MTIQKLNSKNPNFKSDSNSDSGSDSITNTEIEQKRKELEEIYKRVATKELLAAYGEVENGVLSERIKILKSIVSLDHLILFKEIIEEMGKKEAQKDFKEIVNNANQNISFMIIKENCEECGYNIEAHINHFLDLFYKEIMNQIKQSLGGQA